MKEIEKKPKAKLIAKRDFLIVQNQHFYDIKKGDDIEKLKVPLKFYDNLKTEKIEKFTNLDIIKKYIEKNITVKKEYLDVIEYQPPQDILLDGQQEDGEVEITINYKGIPLLNQTIMLYDYKYGTDKQEKEKFIEKFIPTMKENYINCLAHIFTTMEFKEDTK